jgi:hypothetical protein
MWKSKQVATIKFSGFKLISVTIKTAAIMDCVLANPLERSANPWGFANHTLGTTVCTEHWTCTWRVKDRGESVSIVTRLRVGRPGFDFRQGMNFLFATASGPALRPVQLASSEIKREERKANHAFPSSAEVKDLWSYTSSPPYVWKACAYISIRDNSILKVPVSSSGVGEEAPTLLGPLARANLSRLRTKTDPVF